MSVSRLSLVAVAIAGLTSASLATGCNKNAEPAATPVPTQAAAAEAAAPPSAASAVPMPAAASAGELPPGHPPTGGQAAVHGAEAGKDPHAAPAPAAQVEIGEFAPADMKIADLRAQRAANAGKVLSMRGRVVKINRGIMGKNWIHLRDSSDALPLVITTQGDSQVGALVVAKGKVGVDRDIGAGYNYDVLLEDSEVTPEGAAPAAAAPAPAAAPAAAPAPAAAVPAGHP